MSGGGGQHAFPPFTIHDAGGELVHANDAAAAWLGTDASRLAGKGYLDHIHVQDRVAAARAFRSHSGRVSEDSVEFRPLPKPANKHDGAGSPPAWIEAKIRHISMDGSAYVVAMLHDTTGVHELNNALERVREESEKTSIAKSRFFANVSHELRTPLNAILGFSELLTSPVMADIDDSKRNEYADLIHESANHLLAVLNDILDMSKIESGNYDILPETFNLAACLEGTVAIMRGQADLRGIGISMYGFRDLPEIVADKRAIRQIMINLLSNAVKFSENGQEVRVVAERLARRVRIHVQDDGIGISPEHLENLGKPFFQADSRYDRKYEGTGLGLSVVKGLVTLHGGEITFNSARDKGTVVTVELPIHGNGARMKAAPHEPERLTAIPLAANAGPAPGAPEAQQFKIIRNSA
jgi:cell cycle sensor histidine kinase DivJ